MARVALVAGSTGLIGRSVVQELLAQPQWDRVVALVRKPSGRQDPRLEERVVDFDALETAALEANDVFCCLGTTIKTAGSQAAFHKVDHDYVVALARRTHALGASQFLVVSAVGASARSRAFYNRVKGEMEADVKAVGFAGLHIFQPGLLLGERGEHRAGEAVAQRVAPLLDVFLRGGFARYHSVAAATVARAMVQAAREQQAGLHVHHWPEMESLAGRQSEAPVR